MIATLADQIHEAHAAATQAAHDALEHARRAGELLLQAKAAVSHGGWLQWLREHCLDITPRTCQRYMLVAEQWDEIVAARKTTCESFSLAQALRVLTTGEDEPRPRTVRAVVVRARRGARPDDPDRARADHPDLHVPDDGDHDDQQQPRHVDVLPAPPSNGLQFARIAIMKLDEIRPEDLERAGAFSVVRKWLDARQDRAQDEQEPEDTSDYEDRFDPRTQITLIVNYIRSIVAVWPRDVRFTELIISLRHEADRLQDRQEKASDRG
jgi:hypothetical protein